MRVVINIKTNKYEIHRTNFLFGNQVWENDGSRSGYWWTFYPDNASKFNSPEEAERVFNHSRKISSIKLFRTVKRFW